MLKQASISRSISMLAGVSLLMMLGILFFVLVQVRGLLIDQKRDELRNIVNTATNIVKGRFDELSRKGVPQIDALREASEVLRSAQYGKQNYFFVYDTNGNVLMHGNRKDFEGTNRMHRVDASGVKVVEDFVNVVKSKNAGYTEYTVKRGWSESDLLKITYLSRIGNTEHFVGSGLMVEDIEMILLREAAEASIKMLPFFILFLLGTVHLGRKIAQTLRGLTASVQGIAAGDLEVSVQGVERKDEVGLIARALLVFRDALLAKRTADEANAAHEAREAERQATIAQAIAHFEGVTNAAVLAITSTSAELEASANMLAESASSTNQQASSVSDTAANTSQTFQELASAEQHLTGTIQNIAGITTSSSELARGAVDSLLATEQSANALVDATKRIGTAIDLINGLAERTNMLALNATIESARAGQAGRGFAIVASEVKTLAGQTKSATDEIAVMVDEIRIATESTVSAIQTVGKVINRIEGASQDIALSITEQSRASEAIATVVHEAVSSSDHMRNSIEQVRHTAHDTNVAADEVRSAAGDLSDRAEALRKDVESFLQTVRAA